MPWAASYGRGHAKEIKESWSNVRGSTRREIKLKPNRTEGKTTKVLAKGSDQERDRIAKLTRVTKKKCRVQGPIKQGESKEHTKTKERCAQWGKKVEKTGARPGNSKGRLDKKGLLKEKRGVTWGREGEGAGS